MLRLLTTLVFMLAPVFAQAAEKRQIGNIVFEPPKEWQVGGLRDEGWLTLINDREDERCEFCYINVHIGTPAKGSFKAWLRRRMKAALEDGVVLKKMPVKTIPVPGVGAMEMHARYIKDRGREMQIFLAFKLEERWELIHFEGDADDVEELKEVQATVSEELLPMVGAIGFVSEGAEPVLGDPAPGPLDGVWFGSKIRYGINLDGSMRMDVDPVIYAFWPDGRFYEGIPDGGLSAFDAKTALLERTDQVGNYQVRGKRLTLAFADGDTDTLEIDGETIEDGDAILSKVRIPDDGYRFEGQLYNFNYYPFAPGISGGVAASSDWRFRKDGTWTGSNFTGGSGDMGSASFAFGNPGKDKRGRYEIGDGLIRLIPPDGKGETLAWPFFLQEYEGAWRPIVRGEYLQDEE